MQAEPRFWETLTEHIRIARTLRNLQIHYDPDKCTGVWQCYEVCPVGCWTPDRDRHKVIFHDPQKCIACGAACCNAPKTQSN